LLAWEFRDPAQLLEDVEVAVVLSAEGAGHADQVADVGDLGADASAEVSVGGGAAEGLRGLGFRPGAGRS